MERLIRVFIADASRDCTEMLCAALEQEEDIAVVGYDDYSDNKLEGVALTTYHVNVEEMISQCMNILEQHCENSEYRYGTVISYGWLVERNTGKRKEA